MSGRKLRVIVLTHGGCEIALQRLLEVDCVEIAGVFVETAVIRRRGLREKIARSIRYDGYFETALKFARTLSGADQSSGRDISELTESRGRLRAIAEENHIPFYLVDDYHSEYALLQMRAASPDLGVLLGTNILKESVFGIPRLGSINLHQGLAPYYRGGPSVFWELCNGEREVGITVHFVAAKVDIGDIILQRTVPLEYDYSYRLNYQAFIDDYRQKLTFPCANLVAEAVRLIAEGKAVPAPQEAGVGKRYRLPTKKEKDELKRRLRKRYANAAGSLSHKMNTGS